MINTENISFKHRLDIQIRMTDLDPFQHVNNGILCAYFDLGRLQYMKDIVGYLSLSELDMVLVHTEFDYLHSIRFHDEIAVETTITGIGEKSVKMLQRIVSKDNSTTYCLCYSVLSGYDRSQDCSKKINETFKKIIFDFEQG